MKIPGVYRSQLQDFFYQQLAALAQKAVSSGEFAGGSLLDQSVIDQLKAQAQDFSGVPFVGAGERATWESIEQAVDMLKAKYSAMADERNQFVLEMNRFLAVLRQDNQLVEGLIRQAEFEAWKATLPAIYGAKQFGWDFGVSAGVVPADKQSSLVDLVVRKEAGGDLSQGIMCAHRRTEIPVSSMQWKYETTGKNEELYGPDWARLAVLEPTARESYGAPEVGIILPKDGVTAAEWQQFFTVTGKNGESNVPVYIRNFFLPRRAHKVIQFGKSADQDPVTLSPYRVSPDDVLVYRGDTAFFKSYDFEITSGLQIKPLPRLYGQQVTVAFTEYFPAFQCSVDQKNWSAPVMLDPEQPVPDDAAFTPVFASDGRFPITDESGNHSGLFLQVNQTITKEFTVCIQNSRPSSGSAAFGLPAVLELEFEKPLFLNGVHLEPFVNFPFFLRSIYCESILGSNPETVWSGDYLLDRAQDVLFAKRDVLRMRLEFFQPSFSVKEHMVDVENRKKLEAMISIQAALPYRVRNIHYPLTAEYNGCQYEFGLRQIAGVVTDPVSDVIYGAKPELWNGPFESEGVPDLVRLDVAAAGSVDTFLVSEEVAADGTTSALVEKQVTAGETTAYTKVGETPANAKFYVKFRLNSPDALIQRFSLQVKNVQ